MNILSAGLQRSPARALLCVSIGLTGSWAQATSLTFDPRFLEGASAASADVTRFEHADTVPEGDQVLDIRINEDWRGRWSVPLRRNGQDLQASPCYSHALLQALAIDLSRLAAPAQKLLQQPDACVPLAALGLVANEHLDFSQLRLSLHVAQTALLQTPRDYLPPEQWDSGTHAAFVDYRLNLFRQQDRRDGQHWNQSFLGLRSGVNLGGWYWRHEANLQVAEAVERVYRPLATYVRREVAPWRAQLTLGEAYSRGEVFDRIAYLGLGVGSDERMLPASARGFAPSVSGVAYSTALLTIRQRGVVLHESTVQPGPFNITDLYASSLSDDLEVTLREADGNLRTFSVPYQTAPLALRPGASRFDFSLGRWRDSGGDTGPEHVQGSWQQGLNNHLSGHVGLIGASSYQSGAAGVAINSALGAVGLTGFQSRAEVTERLHSRGQAVRLNWRQELATSRTQLSASLTSSTQDYLGFNDFAYAQHMARHASHPQSRARLRATFAVNYGLAAQGGRLNFSASRTRRWGNPGSDLGYSFGYYHRYGALGYGITASREQYAWTGSRNTVGVTLSMPLGETRRSSLISSLNRDARGQGSTSTRLSSTVGDYAQWGYGLGVTTRHDQQRDSAAVNSNLLYRGSLAELSASLTHHSDYRQASLGVRGALVGHAGGVTGAQSLGESFAIVHAPGAANARLKQAQHVRLDGQGYGVLPYLTPYSLNTVELDPKGTSRDVELQISSQQVVPRAGAAALLYYPTRSGRTVLIDARLPDGSALPFGAQVLDESGQELGVVGQGSRLYVRGVNQQGRLLVRWGESIEKQCSIPYLLPESAPAGTTLTLLAATCALGEGGALL